MALQADQLGDLVAATLKDLGEMKITDISVDLQEHVAMRTLLKKNRIQLESGTGVQWDIMTQHSGGSRFVGLYATDNVNVGDVLIQGTAPWRHSTSNYAFDEREIDMNGSPRRIVDLMKIRRYDCMIALAELLEAAFWQFPSSTDAVTPYGVAYWIVKNNTTGFNGSVQSGYTTVGGVDPAVYTRWKNWTAQYTDVTEADLITKWREAATKTTFNPPVPGPATFNTGDRYGYYTNYSCIASLESLLMAQNDNLGNDLAPKDGQTTFRRTNVQYVPKLDEDTTDPIYGINWGVFKTYILRGWWLRETRIAVTPGQHTVASVHVDNTLNWICKDRRRNFVLAKNTTYPF